VFSFSGVLLATFFIQRLPKFLVAIFTFQRVFFNYYLNVFASVGNRELVDPTVEIRIGRFIRNTVEHAWLMWFLTETTLPLLS